MIIIYEGHGIKIRYKRLMIYGHIFPLVFKSSIPIHIV